MQGGKGMPDECTGRGAKPEQVPLGIPTPVMQWSVFLHQYCILGLGVYLNPSTGGIKHGNAVVIVDPYGTRV